MKKIYYRQDLTGGETGAGDNINGALLADGDALIVSFPLDHATYPGEVMMFNLDADSGEATSLPTCFPPATNAGDKRWKRSAFTPSGSPVNATVKTGSFAGFTGAETKEVDITGISSNNPVIRKAQLYISNDSGADENINFRLGFYNSDSMTEDELITAFYFNLTYTESNGGASATDTTDTVDDISGLVLHDFIRYMEGTAENVRLTAVPSGTTLTFTALAEDHADDGGIVKVVEITGMFQLFDADSSNEIHAKLETFSSPNASMNVALNLEVQ